MNTDQLAALVAHYGYAATFLAVLAASSGAPIPAGEILIAAAVFAAETQRLSLPLILLLAAIAAVLGGVAGHGLGRAFATEISRHGRLVGLTPARIRLGRYLFQAHGGKIVFFVRFIALLGPFGGLLSGMNRMDFRRFLLFNALGGVAWALAFGIGGYLFGSMLQAAGPRLGVAAVVLTLALLGGLAFYLRGHAAELQRQADAAFPDG